MNTNNTTISNGNNINKVFNNNNIINIKVNKDISNKNNITKIIKILNLFQK